MCIILTQNAASICDLSSFIYIQTSLNLTLIAGHQSILTIASYGGCHHLTFAYLMKSQIAQCYSYI